MIFPENVPTVAALIIAASGVAAGVTFGRVSARDTLAAARRLASAGATYWVRADSARTYVKAIESPTMAVPTIELLASVRTPVERLRDAAVNAVERVREAAVPTPGLPDWAPGEMTAAFNKITENFDSSDTATTLPAQPSPWVHPLAVRGSVPQIVHAPREAQPAPRWENRPAPVPAQDAPSRARLRRSEAPGMPGRLRTWGGSLLGPVPTLPELALPRPFRMPEPRKRLPHDPRRMTMLDPDDTRQFRVKVVAA